MRKVTTATNMIYLLNKLGLCVLGHDNLYIRNVVASYSAEDYVRRVTDEQNKDYEKQKR